MAAASPELVRLDREGAVATLTIDHPPVNVLSAPVLDRIVARLEELRADPSVRAVVLASAAEKAFAAGADIKEMAGLGPSGARVHGERGQATTVAIEQLPMPVIAAVHGSCLGGGCEIALACDLVVASPDAKFGQPEVNLGVMPGWGGTQRLPRRVGASQARYWIYTGRPVSAEEAMRQGWVLRVVARDRLLAEAQAIAAEIAGKAADAIAAAKYCVQFAVDRGIVPGLTFELRHWEALFATADQKEGMRAFLEKRAYSPAPRDPASSIASVAGRTPPPKADAAGGKRKN